MDSKAVLWGFDYLNKDRVCTHVNVMSDLSIEFENFTNGVWLDNFFGRAEKADMGMLLENMEERCFPRTRVNCRELLDRAGLDEYSPLDIVHITHGIMSDDMYWIRFDNEPELTWDMVAKDWWVRYGQ